MSREHISLSSAVRSAARHVLGVCAVLALGAGAAEAVCIDKTPGLAPNKLVKAPRFEHGGPDAGPGGGNVSIVGLWQVDFRFPNGDPYDSAFEQWHEDGTELTLDTAVPPSMGNICLGVWKKTGPRTVKLTHVGWNWTPDGKLAGTFWLWMTATIDRRGQVFTGKFVTDSYDLDGNVIPELHADGTVRGTRIDVD